MAMSAKGGYSDFWFQIAHSWVKDMESASPGIPFKQVSFEEFETFISNITQTYSRRKMSRALLKISGKLEHVKSFSAALSSFSQLDMLGMLVWGSLQLVIECVCRYSNEIESTCELIANMHAALPSFKRGLALHPHAESLRFPLKDLFNEYIGCCLVIVKEFNNSPFKNLLKKLVSSGLKKTIMKSTTRIAQYEKQFQQALNRADQEAATSRDILTAQRLGELGDLTETLWATNFSAHIPMPATNSQTRVIQPGNTIPGLPNPFFVGRERELQEIHDCFTAQTFSRGTGPACVLIHGLGGQGKTQTALAYYWRYRNSYEGTFFLKSETAEKLEESYLAIARKLRLAGYLGQTAPPSPDSERNWEIERTREWLEGTNSKWLLIFDNLEDARLIENYVPENLSGGSIIITTQHAHISPITNDFHKLELQPMVSESGSDLFFKVLSRDAKDEDEKGIVYQICDWVGGLPLAIVTVAGYLSRSTSSAAEIFASLRRSSQIWVNSSVGAPGNYERTLATVFDLALGHLSENSSHFLQILAFLSPDGIPEDLLRCRHDMSSLAFLNDEDEYLSVREDLGHRQLIKWIDGDDGKHLEIHRSLQMNLLLGLAKHQDSSKRSVVFTEVTAMIHAALPEATRLQQNEKDIWPTFARYTPQVLALRQNSQWPVPPIQLDIQFAKMLSNVGTFLWHTGQIRECTAAMDTAESIIKMQPQCVQRSQDCEILLSDIYLVAGIVADCVGVTRRRQSLDYRLKLLELRERELGDIPPERVTMNDEIRWGNAKGDLACAYLQRSEFGKTRDIMEKLYTDYYQKWGSEEEIPFEYSKYWHHMGHVLMAEGQPDKALEWSRKGMELDLAHAGSIDSTVLIDRYDIACLLFNAGKVAESLEAHEEVLRLRIQTCGKSAQFTLESYEAVGIIQHLLGRNQDAEANFKTCLSSQFRYNWTIEGITRAQYWYSRVLAALGKQEAAATEYSSAAAAKEKLLSEYPEFLKESPANEAAVFDQMLPMWIMQTTGPLQDGGRNPRPRVTDKNERDGTIPDKPGGKVV
ncbi:P-loop containing nucleoside triphosphate hydrolase protein, partial [Xylaria palmicola]